MRSWIMKGEKRSDKTWFFVILGGICIWFSFFKGWHFKKSLRILFLSEFWDNSLYFFGVSSIFWTISASKTSKINDLEKNQNGKKLTSHILGKHWIKTIIDLSIFWEERNEIIIYYIQKSISSIFLINSDDIKNEDNLRFKTT